MKRMLVFILIVSSGFILSSCSNTGVETDYPAAIMVDDVVYYKTMDEISGEFTDSQIAGYTKYKDGFPEKNGQANFSRNGVPYARYGEDIAVCIDGTWFYCRARDLGNDAEAPQNNDAVLKEPPALTISISDKNIEAMRGTSSWMYDNGDGTWSGVESDSVHPLDNSTKEYMPKLMLTSSELSSTVAVCSLWFDTFPDETTIRCWEERQWGDTSAESEPVSVSNFTMELKDGGYIYEVIATWNSSEKYNGKAYYSFYAKVDAEN